MSMGRLVEQKLAAPFYVKINVLGFISMNQEILQPLSSQEMTKYRNSVIIIVFYTIDLHIKHVRFCVKHLCHQLSVVSNTVIYNGFQRKEKETKAKV